MALDFPNEGIGAVRARRGRCNQLAGASAEGVVERVYLGAGHRLLERRWRGKAGEIDLILEDADGTLVFVEVKTGPDTDRALARISPAQVARIHHAVGRVEILEGALLGY